MKISASEAFVEGLVAEGVDTVFGLVGSAFMDPLDLFPRAGIRFISVRHEQNAALMAEGYARATGKVGVCIGQNGPGVTNLVTGIMGAYANHTPVVVVTPSVTSMSLGTYAIQEVDQMGLFRPIVSYQVQVNRPERMAWAVRNAFRAAYGLRGPAQIDIPRDYFYGTVELEFDPAHKYRALNFGMGAPSEAIATALDVIRSAERPVIVAGLGVTTSGCVDEVEILAERLGSPVVTTYLHNDAFSTDRRLGLGPLGYGGSKAAMRVIADADVVLILGSRLNRFGTIPHYDVTYWPEHAKVIHNALDPLVIGRDRSIEVGLVGDAKCVTQQLLSGLAEGGPGQVTSEWVGRAIAERERWSLELESMSMVAGDPIHPRRALWELSRSIPEEAIITSDVGNVSGTAGAYFTRMRPRRFLAAGTLGGIGVAYSTALGAKVGVGDSHPVVSLSGDGAWSMTVQEVMTAVTERINSVAVVLNNSEYGAEKKNQYDFFDERFFFTDLNNPDFAAVAEAMGGVGLRVRVADDIIPAMKEALSTDRPVVVEIPVDPGTLTEPYRRDAFQPPVRLMEKYR